jgi:hypothetical protein
MVKFATAEPDGRETKLGIVGEIPNDRNSGFACHGASLGHVPPERDKSVLKEIAELLGRNLLLLGADDLGAHDGLVETQLAVKFGCHGRGCGEVDDGVDAFGFFWISYARRRRPQISTLSTVPPPLRTTFRNFSSVGSTVRSSTSGSMITINSYARMCEPTSFGLNGHGLSVTGGSLALAWLRRTGFPGRGLSTDLPILPENAPGAEPP